MTPKQPSPQKEEVCVLCGYPEFRHPVNKSMVRNGYNKDCKSFTPKQRLCALCGKPKEEHYYKMGQLNSKFPYCKGNLTNISDDPQFTPQQKQYDSQVENKGSADENQVSSRNKKSMYVDNPDTQTPLSLKKCKLRCGNEFTKWEF